MFIILYVCSQRWPKSWVKALSTFAGTMRLSLRTTEKQSQDRRDQSTGNVTEAKRRLSLSVLDRTTSTAKMMPKTEWPKLCPNRSCQEQQSVSGHFKLLVFNQCLTPNAMAIRLSFLIPRISLQFFENSICLKCTSLSFLTKKNPSCHICITLTSSSSIPPFLSIPSSLLKLLNATLAACIRQHR